MQMIGLNNQSKIKGIVECIRKVLGKTKEQIQQLLDRDDGIDIKVRFVAIEDENTTPMCNSLNEQLFSINRVNKFERYYGKTTKELKLKKFKIKGLLLGINLPPIIRTFSLLQEYFNISNRCKS